MKRSYEKKIRAEGQARTRQKIIDATMALHQAKGLAATSVSDVAKLAKVGKVTVYRHFPDETALVSACSGQYFTIHPLPDPEKWLTPVGDAQACLQRGLAATYDYHSATEPMMRRILAEARDHPLMAPYHEHWHRAAELLASTMPVSIKSEKTLMAILALALSFDSWTLLVREQGLRHEQAIAMMMRLIFKK